ncbi:MAG: leucine-rich repeat domain-containing protein [Spirochaetaceae bacterium]|nr:leucine-rich repeat domain-containing protein [Spirochaetaceae bacterium]
MLTTKKSNNKHCIAALLAISAQALFLTTCGNPIIESMMTEETSQQPRGETFNTDDADGLKNALAAYINENNKSHSQYNPIPIQFTGSDYHAITAALSGDLITDYSYLYLDMRGMTGLVSIPEDCFNAEKISQKCKIIAVKLSPVVTTIDKGAFSLNADLISVSMPGVNVISEKAFYKTYSLQEIFMPSSPPNTAGDSFYGIMTNLPFIIHVPAGTSYNPGSDYFEWAEKYFGAKHINVHFLADMPGN